jgi:Fibronectin type III domain
MKHGRLPAVLLAILAAAVAVAPGMPQTLSQPGAAPSVPSVAPSIVSPDTTPTVITSVTNFSTPMTLTPEFFGVDVRNDQSFTTANAEELAAAHILTWRYPGGGQAEFFNVSTNVQEVYGYITEPNSPANIVAKCELVHCHLIFQLPAEIDSPSTDAYYVSYVENTLHFTPFMWELGNEPSHFRNFTLPWNEWLPTNPVLNATPLSYSAILPGLISAIRGVDLTTPIDPIGGTGTTASNTYVWYQDVAAAVGPEVQYVSIHSYLGGSQKTSTALFYSPLTQTLNRLPVALPKLYQYILRGCPTCTNIKVILSEDGASIQPTNAKYEKTFAMPMWDAFEAIQAAYGGAASVDLFAFKQTYPGSFLIGGNPYPYPSYYYAKDITPLLGTTVENVTYNNADSGKLLIGAFWEPANNWSMLMVNIDTSNSQSVSWSGSGFPTTGNIEVYIWNSTALEPTGYPTNSMSSIVLAKNSMAEILVYPGGSVSAPAAPSGLIDALNNTTSVRVSWAQPAGPVTNDSVTYGTPTGSAPYCSAIATVSANASAWGLTLNHLLPTKNYCFAARAYNSAGASALSAYVNISTTLGPPTNFKIVGVSSTYVNMTWVNPGVSSPYTILNDSMSVGYYTTTGCYSITNLSLGAVTTYNLTGLRPGLSYCMSVAAWDQNGEGPSATTVQTSVNSGPLPVLALRYIMGGNNTSYTSIPLQVPANDLILVGIGIRNGVDAPTVSDSAGDTFTLIASNGTRAYSSAPNSLFLYDAYPSIGVPGGSGGVTFTCNNGGATFAGACEILVYGNVYTVPIDDQGWGTYGGNVGGKGRNPFDLLNTTNKNDTMDLFAAESNENPAGIAFTSDSAAWLNQTNVTGSSNTKGESLVDAFLQAPSTVTNENLSVLATPTDGGVWQAFSVAVRGSPLVAGPHAFVETGFTNHTLSFSWVNPSGAGVDLKNDTVYYSSNNVSFTPYYPGSVVTSVTLTGLVRNEQYDVYVQANNVSGSFGSSLIAIAWTYDPPPPAPTNLHVIAVGSQSVTLAWVNPVVGGLLNDSVYESSNNVSFFQLDVLNVTTTDLIGGLNPSTQYYFYVTATTDGGEGSPSPAVGALTLLFTPTGLNVTGIGSRSVSLAWLNPTGLVVTNDTVWYGTSCSAVKYSVSTGGPSVGFSVQGLSPSVTYCFQVQAWNGSASSGRSTTVSATTLQPPIGGGRGSNNSTPPAPAPTPPQNLPSWHLIAGYGVGAVVVLLAVVYSVPHRRWGSLAIGAVGIILIAWTYAGFPT